MNINVKDFASTETKSCIGAEIGMFVNGSVFDDFPFILSAHDADGTSKLVKILRVVDEVTPLASREQDVRNEEAECVKLVYSRFHCTHGQTHNQSTSTHNWLQKQTAE